MNIASHPHDDALMAHAAGTLDAPLAYAVELHRQLCPRCQARYRSALEVGGRLLDDIDVAPSTAASAEDAWIRMQRVMRGDMSRVPRAAQKAGPFLVCPSPNALLSMLRTDMAWKPLTPGIEHFRLTSGVASAEWLRLFRFQPGVSVPMHSHGGEEFTVVLQGSYADQTGHFGAGDFADNDHAVTHQPQITSEIPCIALVAATSRTRFKNPVYRAFAQLVGI